MPDFKTYRMQKNRIRPFLFLLSLACLIAGCKKYLDKVPDTLQVVPNTLEGYGELLDNNLLTRTVSPALGQLGCDDYYSSAATLAAADPLTRKAYTWADNPYDGQPVADWSRPYTAIYYCNVILSGLPSIVNAAPDEYNAIKGGALFCRAFHFYSLQEVFGEPYRPSDALHEMGIILRLDPNPAAKLGRASTDQVFRQVLRDLRQALPLLPVNVQHIHPNRPCKSAVFALLARVCLTMQDYKQAGLYADSCLRLYSTLLNFDTLNKASTRPFTQPANDEVLFLCSMQNYSQLYGSGTVIDSVLYNSYDSDDLRKTLFFRNNSFGQPYFKGQFTGLSYLYTGVAVDEVFLVRAECAARDSNREAALQDLNTLLVTRWKKGAFLPRVAATAGEALGLILKERRKELLFRGLRWSDLRRLNQDARYSDTLKRIVNGTIYTLYPGDARYTFPIPDEEIHLSGIPQNPR
jgi:starch-binding outer membrane protein, SusD/RagB family